MFHGFRVSPHFGHTNPSGYLTWNRYLQHASSSGYFSLNSVILIAVAIPFSRVRLVASILSLSFCFVIILKSGNQGGASLVFAHPFSAISTENAYTVRITLQGFPTAKLFGGMFFVTTLPAPIMLLLPIVTPGSTMAPVHIQTLSPI